MVFDAREGSDFASFFGSHPLLGFAHEATGRTDQFKETATDLRTGGLCVRSAARRTGAAFASVFRSA